MGTDLKKCPSTKLDCPFDFTEDSKTLNFTHAAHGKLLLISAGETDLHWAPKCLPFRSDNSYRNLAPAEGNALNTKHLPSAVLHESCCKHQTFPDSSR